MSLRSRQILSDPGLRGALETGEVAREYVPLSPTNSGAERDVPVGTKPAAPTSEGALRETGGFLAGSWLPRWARGDRPDRLVGGIARQGVAGSVGAGLAAAQATATGLVVTDRRLVSVVEGATAMVDDPEHPGRRMPSIEYRVVWSAPVDAVVAARRSGRLTGRGRVELYFDDASMCTVVTGVLTTGAADRLLDTLALPDPPTEGENP